MKPKPLHRSITFWSGIFVMLFIVWAWWNSMKVVSRGNIARLSVSSYCGGMELADTGIRRGYYIQRYGLALPEPPAAFPAPFFVRGQGPAFAPWAWNALAKDASYVDQASWRARILPLGSVTIFIPYWLLLLVAAAAWIGLLFWRARRIRSRVMERDLTPR
jgi:hypothetical protein